MDMFLFIVGFFGLIVFLVMIIVNAVKKKPKRNQLIGLAICFALMVVGASISPDDRKEDPNLDSENEIESSSDTEETKATLTDAEKSLLKKKYSDFTEQERTDFVTVLEKFDNLSEENKEQFSADVDRLKSEQEKKEWEEFVANNTKELSAGEHTVGKQIASGAYDVTFPNGSGNFIINSSDGQLMTNEIGGSNGISKYRAILIDGEKISLKSTSALFTPTKREAMPYENLDLYSGYWVVGQDLTEGRYKVTPASGSGNFIVYSSDGSLETNEILGGEYGVSEVAVNLDNGDIVQISSLNKVNFAPEK